MKRILHVAILLAGLSLTHTLYGQNGAITGVILDENNLAMPGANVFISSLNLGSSTDAQGRFELLNVPPGDHEVTISFIGYENLTQTISVTSGTGDFLRIPLVPASLTTQDVVVIGDRLKGQAKALNDQKNRANISNIVASDQIGRFPDANIGDALKRIPGITMQNDQGEARDIIVRGMAPQLNSVTLNGQRIPSAEGDNRRVQMDLIPSDMISLIQVNKVVTPDMDADAIGGSVNLVTRTVANDRRISGTLASGYNFLSNKPIGTMGLILGDRFADNKLGVIASLSYNNHQFGSDNMEAEWVENDRFGVIMDEFQLRTYEVQRIRRSASIGLDYQFNANNQITLSGIYNWRDDWENRYRFVAKDMGDAVDADLATGRAGTKIIDIESTVERQSKGGINSDRVDNRRLEDQRTANFSLTGKHLIANKLKLTWSGAYARASEERLNERYIQYAGDEIPLVMDLSNTRFPLVTLASEADQSTLEFDELTDETQFTEEQDRNGKIDLQLPVGSQGVLKFGGIIRSKTKERDNSFFEYTPIGNTAGASHPDFGGAWDADEEEFSDLVLGDVPLTNKTKDDFLAGNKYDAGNYVSEKFLGGLDLKDGSLYEEEDKPDEYAPGNYKSDEVISGAYAMVDYQLIPQLSAIAGIRIENTNIDYEGFSYDDDSEEVGTTSGNNSYTNILPNLQFKYNLTENTILRLAYSNTIARPGYFQLVPFEEWVPEDNELTVGNPELDPTTSLNLDFMAERYFEDVGIVSFGLFYKNVQDFIFEQEVDDFVDPTYGTVDLTTFNNGQEAQVAGVEAAVQKQFGRFGVYLNYTYTNSSTEGIEGREGEDIPLPGTAENMYNASLSYETQALVLRLSLNHASDYIDELGGEAFEDRYYDKQTFLDCNASYALNQNWRIFGEWNNITNQPLRFYQGRSALTMQEEYYNSRFNLGVKFDLFGK